MKVNKRLVPLKAHYFLFMAASGPVLPYLTVYGKQLGISEVMMGSITAVLPLVFLLAKPVFGFIVDYFHTRRKFVFMVLICSMSCFYILLYFVPPSRARAISLSLNGTQPCSPNELSLASNCQETEWQRVKCQVVCDNRSTCEVTGVAALKENTFCSSVASTSCTWQEQVPCNGTCHKASDDDCIYHTFTFYSFVLLMSLSMIAYNVANSISDAICFDMLGEGAEMHYGRQRVWGAIGFGLTALVGGLCMDLWSAGTGDKNYTPAFVLVMVFTVVDMACCLRLKLPEMGQSTNILKDLGKVVRHNNIIVFLLFATLAGILDSFIIYFMFWFLEDMALEHGQMGSVKLLEGLTVAVETLGGEVIFFPLSGKILQWLGYGHCLSICFLNYAIRLGLLSLIPSPWWILPVEFFMQGPTYALCYTTIVAYASAISPPGTSATMQGVVAGMDDGFGYALGSLIGGFLYRAVGGRMAFRAFSATALLCCVAHCVLYKYVLSSPKKAENQETRGGYMSPGAAIQMTQVATVAMEKQTVNSVS